MSRLVDCYGAPDAIRLDNGPKLVSQAFTEWAAAKGIAVRYIQPGKPNQNAFIERFNRAYRTEVLDAHLFANLEQVQAITDQWLVDYNEYRPHEALGGVPPVLYMPRLLMLRISIGRCLLDRGGYEGTRTRSDLPLRALGAVSASSCCDSIRVGVHLATAPRWHEVQYLL
nr:transposase family protein [Bordetella genomosp. 13]